MKLPYNGSDDDLKLLYVCNRLMLEENTIQ